MVSVKVSFLEKVRFPVFATLEVAFTFFNELYRLSTFNLLVARTGLRPEVSRES